MNYLDEAVTKSLDEFMEYYKVVDTENIYSIGIEFVPIFRVKQWEEYNNKDKEIERLNNIINKLETGIENMWVDNTGEDTWEYEEEACLYREEFLDKIKELKGVDKE